MSDRVFLDTNIFVYGVDGSDPKSSVADKLINVVLTKFAKPMATEQAARYMSTVFRSLHLVHSSLGLFIEAMEIRSRYRLSWFDSLILGAASTAGCQKLYSEDMQDGALIAAVRIVNPFRRAN